MTKIGKTKILAKYIFMRTEIARKRLKLKKIWCDIPIGLDRPYLYGKDYFFVISTPSPLKLALKMTNIAKIAILAKIEYF